MGDRAWECAGLRTTNATRKWCRNPKIKGHPRAHLTSGAKDPDEEGGRQHLGGPDPPCGHDLPPEPFDGNTGCPPYLGPMCRSPRYRPVPRTSTAQVAVAHKTSRKLALRC